MFGSTHTHSRRTRAWLIALAIGAVVLLASVVVWGVTQPMHLTVNGVEQAVAQGSTIADLQGDGVVSAHTGDLVSVKGAVLRKGGGRPPLITRNGVRVAITQRVYDGDAITSSSGADVVEPKVTVKAPIPIPTRVEGDGAILKLAQTGSPGIQEITRGQVSGSIIDSRVIVPAQEMVIIASHPTAADKLVALTFDDGPKLGQTDEILDILKHYGIHATFFMLGSEVKRYPALASRVATEGNLIGNHTLSHKDLTKQKPAEVKRQIVAGANAIQKATGVRPVWFRPPYGAINGSVWKQARALKVNVVLWDVDTLDWTKPGVGKITSNANWHVKPGSVVLMHDGGGERAQTIAALPRIIEYLRGKGYTFVTLDQLAGAK